MKNWIKGKLSLIHLGWAIAILCVGLFMVKQTEFVQPTSYYTEQIQAAQLMKRSLQIIKEERLRRNIPLDLELDPNQTGVIGEEYTRLTTTLGNLSAKRTSTNPAFAALLVKYFKEVNLKKGDVIAIGASGSFPALIIATLSAARVLELEPLLIYSVGSSEYGANIPEFTFIKMLDSLNNQNILPYSLLATSMGGYLDQAEEMFYPDSRDTIKKIVQSSGTLVIGTDSIEENILQRMQLYTAASNGKSIKAFVNIGGSTPNYGNTNASITYPNGLVINGPKIPNHPERGLIFEYQNLGIPIIHLLNIRDLAVKNGLPIDPVPLPEAGDGGVYSRIVYNKYIITLFIGIEILYLFWASNNKRVNM
ncbi:MAG: poly-gamma-glutamate system protein [Candidatus Caldatribacteriota bacterium]|nr:poly-gamma-glutamate system protein [Candidatus Caldatribacteriota bacterium]